ncbi:MAG: glycosyltransferase family 4 protein [Burkholderiaceae bacterium]
MLKIAIVTNSPPPYRVPIYQRISQASGISLQVIFCCEREPHRKWDLPPLNFNHIFLRERFVKIGGRFIHNNYDVISSLSKFSPDVIVTNGFNPTYLYTFGYALAKGLPHVPMTDGTDISEQKLSYWHRVIRRFVFARSNAFISASFGGQKLYESYGIAAEYCFKSCLCIDNAVFSPEPKQEEKLFDFIFCGRIEQGKGPLFALNVALEVAKTLNRKIRILFAGAGSQEESVKRAASLQQDLVEAEFNGFATQNELPSLYRSARVFLFPTLGDVWGVVANEACAAGLPVIVSPHAGVAGQLVIDGENGYVCDLNVNLWAERAALLLTHPDVYQRFSERSRFLVSEYTFDKAASGLLAACRFALSADKTAEVDSPTI